MELRGRHKRTLAPDVCSKMDGYDSDPDVLKDRFDADQYYQERCALDSATNPVQELFDIQPKALNLPDRRSTATVSRDPLVCTLHLRADGLIVAGTP